MLSPSTTSGRARGAGLVLLVLGLWGALVPFVGPSFGYGMGGAPAWTWTESHVTLHLAPGLAAAVGALFLLAGRDLSRGRLGAWLAAVGGTWFVVGPSLRPLWAASDMSSMGGMGDSALSSALSALGYHYGTGVLIALAAAYALGLLRTTRDAEPDSRRAAVQPDRPVTSRSELVETRG